MRERTEIISSGSETAGSIRSAGWPATRLPMASGHFGSAQEVHHIIMISRWPGFVAFFAVRAAGEDNARY
jgi:hypothetical protein